MLSSFYGVIFSISKLHLSSMFSLYSTHDGFNMLKIKQKIVELRLPILFEANNLKLKI